MVDLVVTAANVIQGTGAITEVGVAGETLVAGQECYLKAADGRIWKGQCDGTAEEATFKGITLHGATVGQPIVYQTGGTLNIGATTVKGTHYVLSAAVGGICPFADLVSTNRVTFIGYATDTAGAFKIFKESTTVVI